MRIPLPCHRAGEPVDYKSVDRWVALRREPEWGRLWLDLGLVSWIVLDNDVGYSAPYMKWRFTFETWCFEVTIDKDDFIDRHGDAWRAEPEFPEKIAMREAERVIRERAAMVGVPIGPNSLGPHIAAAYFPGGRP